MKCFALALLSTLCLSAFAADPRPFRADISKEKPGAESPSFPAMVGNWVVTKDGDRNVILVDGRQWKKGDPSNGFADKARAIYGSKHEEFIDNVKAFAYFPYAVAKDVDDFRNGEIKVRFKLIEGALDQCGGILFDLKPSGDYLAVRFNGKEDNLVLWTFNSGKRKFVKKGVKDVPLPMKEWHEIKIAVKDTQLEGYLDGEKLIDFTLAAPVSGKVGLWSKTDSVTEFDEFVVTPTPAAKP